MAYFYEYLSEEQAANILQHLIRQLSASGLSDVLDNIQESLALLESPDVERTSTSRSERYPRTSRTLLRYYLTGTINYLQNISSHHYRTIVDSIAGNLSASGEQLKDIRVRYTPLSNETTQEREVSLAELPDYLPVITSLQTIRQQLDGYENEPRQG